MASNIQVSTLQTKKKKLNRDKLDLKHEVTRLLWVWISKPNDDVQTFR